MYVDDFKVLYLYNAGVLLSYNEEAILIDGVFNDRNIFDKMPRGYKETLLKKEFPFNNVNTLLFTHCHDDHYDRDTVVSFADKNVKANVIAPIEGRDIYLNGEKGNFRVGEFKIEYLKTRHIFVGDLTCDNYVYKITAGNKTIIITGDTDPKSLNSIFDTFGYNADVFLINAATFLYEMKRPGETPLKKVKNLHVYHLPTEANDDYGYRKATVSVINKAKSYLNNVNYLLDNVKYL